MYTGSCSWMIHKFNRISFISHHATRDPTQVTTYLRGVRTTLSLVVFFVSGTLGLLWICISKMWFVSCWFIYQTTYVQKVNHWRGCHMGYISVGKYRPRVNRAFQNQHQDQVQFKDSFTVDFLKPFKII